MAKTPKSVFQRSRQLLQMTGRLAAQEAMGRLKDFASSRVDAKLALRIQQSEELVRTLGQLKGAAMKAGQLLSLEFSDVLPPEVLKVLRQLHDQAPPGDFSDIDQVLRQDLGDNYLLLEDLQPLPLAAASIGQVHGATYRGQKVAVKVQYPGIADSIGSDMVLLRKLVDSLAKILGKDIDTKPLFREVEQNLRQEVRYDLEADSLERMGELLDPKRYCVPKVYRQVCSQRVLCMSFEAGVPIERWLATDHSQEERDQFGHLILELLLDEFFTHGLVQTDPNYGNFLYRPEQHQLVVLDFGATKSYSKTFRTETLRLLKLAMKKDSVAMGKYFLRHRLLDERESPEVFATLCQLMEQIVEMFLHENQPFRYDDPEYLRNIRQLSTDLVKVAKYSPPAKKFLFLNRKLGGMFHLLKDAGCQIDLALYWQRVAG